MTPQNPSEGGTLCFTVEKTAQGSHFLRPPSWEGQSPLTRGWEVPVLAPPPPRLTPGLALQGVTAPTLPRERQGQLRPLSTGKLQYRTCPWKRTWPAGPGCALGPPPSPSSAVLRTGRTPPPRRPARLPAAAGCPTGLAPRLPAPTSSQVQVRPGHYLMSGFLWQPDRRWAWPSPVAAAPPRPFLPPSSVPRPGCQALAPVMGGHPQLNALSLV